MFWSKFLDPKRNDLYLKKFYNDFCSLHDKYASMYPLLNRARHHLEHVEQNLTKHSDEDFKQVKK